MSKQAQPSRGPRPRTLTEALRSFGHSDLVGLLTRRPDLSYPLPYDLADLSIRAATATSIARAVDSLNSWLRLVCEALAALPDPSSLDSVARLIDAPPETVRGAVAELRDTALLWGEDDQLHLVRGVREYFAPYPGGLAPPSARPLSRAQISAALTDCDDRVLPVLEKLLWSPTGAVRNAGRAVTVSEARSPVDQLLARQLIRPLDTDTVILPREVALHLRDGEFSPDRVQPHAPPVRGTARNPQLVDQAAAGAAFGLLHDLELAVHSLESTPHRLLRTGGLAARDVSLLARNLGTDTAHASFVMECAAAAGLVAPGSNLCLLPTADYDRWATHDAADRWRTVALAWLSGGRYYARSAEPGAHVLGPEADAPGASGVRTLIMKLADEAGAGTKIELESLTAAVSWHRPRAARSATISVATLVDWTWREATWLGLSSLGAVSSYVKVVLAPGSPMPIPLINLFPTPVDRVIVQTDLTAVAPGPLPHALATELRLLADQESRGGGGVYRFSAASLRRAFDAGWSSTEMHAWLDLHSTTGIPQPLAYLIDDAARQYGTIRVGSAVSYLRIDDEAQEAALLSQPDAQYLGLRAVAPGVVLSSADPDELVSFLRRLGHSPAAEDENGRTLSTPPQLRAANPRRERAPQPPGPDEVATLIETAESRRVDEPRNVAAPADPAAATDRTLRDLQSAKLEAQAVRVVYVAADGQQEERELSPLDVAAGSMRAIDRASAQVLTIPLARISSVWPLVDGH